MAAPRRRHDPSLIEALGERPRRFSFFQAVRLLEWEAARQAADPGEAALRPVGEDHDPRGEAVRFHAVTDLAFPADEILALRFGEDGRAHLVETFFGLTGPLGALPESYTSLIQRGLRDKRPGLREFFDIFNHRLTSLFYRAWARYRLAPSFERAWGRGEQDPITGALTALVGLHGDELRRRLSVPDSMALHFGGGLSRRVRPAAVVEDLLTGALGRPVRVEQFRGEWCRLEAGEQTVLPGPGRPEGQFCRLGVDFVAGQRAWEIHGGIRLHIGPLGRGDFRALLPGGEGARRLADLVALAAGAQMDFDVFLTLRAEDVPPLRLGGDGDGDGHGDGDGPRLGWNTWLLGEGGARGDQGVTFRPQ